MARAFICHRGADHNEALCLAEELRERGHQVWVDTGETGVGDSVIRKLNEGLNDLQYLVLCYSASGLAGKWMNIEWMSTLHRQLSGVGVTALPVRRTGGEPPAILADTAYADLVTDWSSGVTALNAAMV